MSRIVVGYHQTAKVKSVVPVGNPVGEVLPNHFLGVKGDGKTAALLCSPESNVISPWVVSVFDPLLSAVSSRRHTESNEASYAESTALLALQLAAGGVGKKIFLGCLL